MNLHTPPPNTEREASIPQDFKETDGRLDLRGLRLLATERMDEPFLKGSGIIKLIDEIFRLREIATAARVVPTQSAAQQIPSTEDAVNARRYEWLKSKATLAYYNNNQSAEFVDWRMYYAFPKLTGMTAIQSEISLDEAIDMAIEKAAIAATQKAQK